MNMFDLCNQMDLESPICKACILPVSSYIAEIIVIGLTSCWVGLIFSVVSEDTLGDFKDTPGFQGYPGGFQAIE